MATLNSPISPSIPPDHSEHSLRFGVKALCTRGDRVLLVKEHHEDGIPFWTLPGGGVCGGESLADALFRELKEELRSLIRIHNPAGTFLYSHTSKHMLSKYVVFQGRLLTPCNPRRSEGILTSRWVSLDSLPPTTLLPVRYFLQEEV